VQPGDYESIANYVCSCIENPDEAVNIAEAGQKTAELLTWNHNAHKLVGLFEELIAKE